MAKTWINHNWEVDSEKDIPHLELQAAINQFGNKGLSKEEAEEQAYTSYKEEKAKRAAFEAALHHFDSAKRSSGEVAKAHMNMYRHHMDSVNLKHTPVPKEIHDAVKNANINHSFVPHKHDEALLKQLETKGKKK